MSWEKHKADTPRLAFPFFLKTAKSKEAFRKNRNALFQSKNKRRIARNVSRMIPKRSMTKFYHVLTSRCKWKPTSISEESRNLGIRQK